MSGLSVRDGERAAVRVWATGCGVGELDGAADVVVGSGVAGV